MHSGKTCILVPARNCARHIPELVSRISFENAEDEIIICDDASSDDTYEVARRHDRVFAIRNDRNLGYGGTSKRLFAAALERGADFAVNIHGDLGHPPEHIPELMALMYKGDVDVVLGSRLLYVLDLMAKAGPTAIFDSAARGGMPFKRVGGHVVITAIQNLCYRTRLHSFHEGMRACTRDVMEWVLRQELTDWYDFDTRMIVAAHHAGLRIKEVALKPNYLPEAESGVPLLRYGLRSISAAIRFALTDGRR